MGQIPGFADGILHQSIDVLQLCLDLRAAVPADGAQAQPDAEQHLLEIVMKNVRHVPPLAFFGLHQIQHRSVKLAGLRVQLQVHPFQLFGQFFRPEEEVLQPQVLHDGHLIFRDDRIDLLLVMTVLTGLLYPLAVTSVAQAVFNAQANGSLVERGGVVVGSRLQAQAFTTDRYFHPRPSHAGEGGYDGAATSGSNYGPTNPELLDLVERRAAAYRDLNGLADDAAVPVDAVTASGSGLDPDISIANAELQAPRVAEARGMPLGTVLDVIRAHRRGRTAGFLGEPRVNVLEINLALDERLEAP